MSQFTYMASDVSYQWRNVCECHYIKSAWPSESIGTRLKSQKEQIRKAALAESSLVETVGIHLEVKVTVGINLGVKIESSELRSRSYNRRAQGQLITEWKWIHPNLWFANLKFRPCAFWIFHLKIWMLEVMLSTRLPGWVWNH